MSPDIQMESRFLNFLDHFTSPNSWLFRRPPIGRRRAEGTMPRLGYHAVRGFLALAFLNYGIAKLADIQFHRAYQPSAFEDVSSEDLTGFQLTWRFFGYSRAYQCFIGLAEVGAAVLLLSTRTTPLGAVAFLPVILNVVLVDLCFGINAGATAMALALLCGDLLLLVEDRELSPARGGRPDPAFGGRFGPGLGLGADAGRMGTGGRLGGRRRRHRHPDRRRALIAMSGYHHASCMDSRMRDEPSEIGATSPRSGVGRRPGASRIEAPVVEGRITCGGRAGPPWRPSRAPAWHAWRWRTRRHRTWRCRWPGPAGRG